MPTDAKKKELPKPEYTYTATMYGQEVKVKRYAAVYRGMDEPVGNHLNEKVEDVLNIVN